MGQSPCPCVTCSMMRTFLLLTIFVLLIEKSFQLPVDANDEDQDIDYRDECSDHCFEAYYDETSDYHDSCYDWCYQMYFYDEETVKQSSVEDRRAKHHGKGKSLDRKAHGHGHKGKRSADLDRGHHGHKGKMAEERKAKHHGGKH